MTTATTTTTTTPPTPKISIPSNLSNTKKNVSNFSLETCSSRISVWIWVGIPTATCANSCDHLFICKHVWNTSLSGSQKNPTKWPSKQAFYMATFFSLSPFLLLFHWTSCVNPVDGIDRFDKRQFNNLLKCDFVIFFRRRPHTRTSTTHHQEAPLQATFCIWPMRETGPSQKCFAIFCSRQKKGNQVGLTWNCRKSITFREKDKQQFLSPISLTRHFFLVQFNDSIN